jgi:endonuclease/exonuclease/phosphatase family metal-dependent hydrolase
MMALRRFKIGTFNLANLVLPNVTYYNNERYSQSKYQKKLAWCAEQLRRMDADVVGFQEVFHLQALQELTDKSGRFANATVGVAPHQSGDLLPMVGVASNLPLAEPLSVIHDFPEIARFTSPDLALSISSFSRPVLKAVITLNDSLNLTLYVVHLKSKRPDIRPGADGNDPLEIAIGSARSLIRRAAEATALRAHLIQTMQNNQSPVVVVGDVNDSDFAVTTEILGGAQPFRFAPEAQKKRLWDVLLYSVQELQSRRSQQNTYYTHIYNGRYESLDHILVSEELYERNPRRVGVVEYVQLLNDHLIDGSLTSISSDGIQSDHGQVVATIRLDGTTLPTALDPLPGQGMVAEPDELNP